MNIKPYKEYIQKQSRNFVSDISKGNAIGAVILLETCVTGGRTYQAYKRGGLVEARERGTEETLGAIFWFGGVKAFNKLGDFIGKKIFGVSDVNFDVGKDNVRKPFENFLQKTKLSEKKLATFKFTKITASILLSNAVIGFIVPKLNQAITNKYKDSLEKLDQERALKQQKNKNNSTNKTDETKNSPAFKGLNTQTLLTITNNFENDPRYTLLSSDAGVAGGRAYNSRNKHERNEALFRDISSIYFYMFCKNHISSVLNYFEDGRTTRLDPVSTEILTNHLGNAFTNNEELSHEDFKTEVFGNANEKLPENIQNKINEELLKLKNAQPNKVISENEVVISLKDFNELSNDSILNKKAFKMSKLQPKVNGVSVLSAEQIKNLYTGGLINDPYLLRKVFYKYTNKKSINPMAYVSEKDLRALKQRMHDYASDIIEKAKKKNQNITIETLKKANKVNYIKNAINLFSGLAISAYFLSTAIPKIQYLMTKKATGENKFPGVQHYTDDK